MKNLFFIVLLLASTTHADLYPGIAATATGVVLVGAGIAALAINQQAQADFNQKYNSSTIWVTGFSGAKQECFEDIPDGNGGTNDMSYPYTGYANGEYLAYVNGSIAILNGTLDYECANTLDGAISKVQRFYTVGEHFGIWYEKANASNFYMKDAGSPVIYGKLGALSLCLGIPSIIFGIAWIALKKNWCARCGYHELPSDVAMQ